MFRKLKKQFQIWYYRAKIWETKTDRNNGNMHYEKARQRIYDLENKIEELEGE